VSKRQSVGTRRRTPFRCSQRAQKQWAPKAIYFEAASPRSGESVAVSLEQTLGGQFGCALLRAVLSLAVARFLALRRPMAYSESGPFREKCKKHRNTKRESVEI